MQGLLSNTAGLLYHGFLVGMALYHPRIIDVLPKTKPKEVQPLTLDDTTTIPTAKAMVYSNTITCLKLGFLLYYWGGASRH